MQISDYVALARRNLAILIAIPLAIAALAFGLVARQPAKYMATAQVLLRPNDPNEKFGNTPDTSGVSIDKLLKAQAAIAASKPVLSVASLDTGLNGMTAKQLSEKLTVAVAPDSQIMSISVTDEVPTTAKAAADAVAAAYIKNRKASAIEGIDRSLAELDTQLESLNKTLDTLSKQAEGVERDTQLATITDQIKSLASDQRALTIEKQLKTGEAEFFDPAEVPDKSVNTSPITIAVLGLIAGLVLAGFVVLLRDRLDTRLRSRTEAEGLTGLPTLAEVPSTKSWRRSPELAVFGAPASQAAEAFRSLRVALQFMAHDRHGDPDDRHVKTIVVTSSMSGDGKSTVSANLAAAFSEAGDRVLLLSADLRIPNSSARSDDGNDLLDLLKAIDDDNANVFDADIAEGTGRRGQRRARARAVQIQQYCANRGENLWVLGASRQVGNPLSLLRSPAMADLFARVRQEFDVTIIDTPPVNTVADPLVVARLADAVLLVTSVAHTQRDSLVRTAEALRANRAELAGLVLNRTSAKHSRYYHAPAASPATGNLFGKLRQRVERDNYDPVAPLRASQPEPDEEQAWVPAEGDDEMTVTVTPRRRSRSTTA